LLVEIAGQQAMQGHDFCGVDATTLYPAPLIARAQGLTDSRNFVFLSGNDVG
jgi:hypothetical protein